MTLVPGLGVISTSPASAPAGEDDDTGKDDDGKDDDAGKDATGLALTFGNHG